MKAKQLRSGINILLNIVKSNVVPTPVLPIGRRHLAVGYTNITCVLIIAFSAAGCRSSGSAVSNSISPPAPADLGDQIIAEYLKRDAAPYRKMRVRFTIRSSDEPDKIYEIDASRRQTPESTATLTQIIKPIEDSDLGSLTFEKKGQKTVIVTYAASRGEFRETDTRKMFFGGLTAGELLGEWDQFTFRQTGESVVEGRKVVVLEGKAKPNATSVASRMTVAFTIDSYVPVEVHMFDNNGREIRVYRSTNIRDDSAHPYAARAEVENPIYKAKITVDVIERDFPATIDDSMFTRDKLKQLVRK